MVLAEKCSKMKLRKCAHTDSIAVISLLCKRNIIVLLFIIPVSQSVIQAARALIHTKLQMQIQRHIHRLKTNTQICAVYETGTCKGTRTTKKMYIKMKIRKKANV